MWRLPAEPYWVYDRSSRHIPHLAGASMSLLSTLTRRDFLTVGTGAAVGLAIPRPGLTGTPPAGATEARARSVILVNLTGGMSHIDSLDMKPEAPAEIRGE